MSLDCLVPFFVLKYCNETIAIAGHCIGINSRIEDLNEISLKTDINELSTDNLNCIFFDLSLFGFNLIYTGKRTC